MIFKSMRYLYIILIILFFALKGFSQGISVQSFKLLSHDLDARVSYPKKDKDGNVCAIIKVVTNQTGFDWDSDLSGIIATVQKTGEIWIYVPKGAKRLSILHEKLGVLRDYVYPISIEEAAVYEMVITTAKIKTVIEEDEIKSAWVTFKSVPDGADVFIDSIEKGTTPLAVKLKTGKYAYRIEKNLYHASSGIVEIIGNEENEKKELITTLSPAYGSLKLKTIPEQGALVLIDDNEINDKTPIQIDKIKSGKHKITVKKELYQPKSIEIEINDGQVTEKTMELLPNFTEINITTQPESDIFIDGLKVGYGTFKGRLISGLHTFEASKDKHYKEIKTKELTAGKSQEINLVLQPKIGQIDINSNPIESIVYLNGEKMGITPVTIKKLLIGDYTLKLEKSGYSILEKKITITEGKTLDINETLSKGREVRFVCQDVGVQLNIDGENKGVMPITLNLSFGNHNVSAKKEGCPIFERKIEVTQNSDLFELPARCLEEAKKKETEEKIKEYQRIKKQNRKERRSEYLWSGLSSNNDRREYFNGLHYILGCSAPNEYILEPNACANFAIDYTNVNGFPISVQTGLIFGPKYASINFDLLSHYFILKSDRTTLDFGVGYRGDSFNYDQGVPLFRIGITRMMADSDFGGFSYYYSQGLGSGFHGVHNLTYVTKRLGSMDGGGRIWYLLLGLVALGIAGSSG